MSTTNQKAYIITGPTSGIGYETALILANYGAVILVGRNKEKLQKLQQTIEKKGKKAISIICDISDVISVRKAAKQIAELGLPIAGLLNNAGIMQMKAATKSKQGWDTSFATNHIGPFAFTEALLPSLPDGANVAFIVSAVEDPERKPAKLTGMRGGQYISAEASARGEWQAGGSKVAGADAYATSKQCILATALAFARETPRLHFSAIEPGITPGTGLSREVNAVVGYLFGLAMYLPPFGQYRSTPKKAAQVIAKIVTETSGKSGVYYDEKGQPMKGSELVHNPKFQDRVVAETRALLSKV